MDLAFGEDLLADLRARRRRFGDLLLRADLRLDDLRADLRADLRPDLRADLRAELRRLGEALRAGEALGALFLADRRLRGLILRQRPAASIIVPSGHMPTIGPCSPAMPALRCL